MRNVYIITLLFSVLFFGCSKREFSRVDPQPGQTEPEPTIKSSDKAITANPSLVGVSGATVSYVATTSTYEIVAPENTSLKSLKLTIKISAKATISPDPLSARDYSAGPVKYTVTAEDGSTQVYYISVTVPKVVLPSGKSCLVSRIENQDTKEYYAFSYDSKSRISEIVTAVMYPATGYVTEWKKLICTYASDGTLSEIKETKATDFNGQSDILYRFIYENGKLTQIWTKDGKKAPVAESVIVDDNNLITRWMPYDWTGSSTYPPCYTYVYSNWSIRESKVCSGNVMWGASYSGEVRHFLSSQINYPGLLIVFRRFADQYDKTSLIPFHFGFYLPSLIDLPDDTECRASYITNSDKFPTEMKISNRWYVSTAFPEQKDFRFKVSYTNCN